MEDLVEREFSGFLGQGQNSDNRVHKQAKAMKLRKEAPSSKLLILFTPRPTNVLYCPNSGGPLRGGQGEVAYSWWEDKGKDDASSLTWFSPGAGRDFLRSVYKAQGLCVGRVLSMWRVRLTFKVAPRT
jgi:hypothetical protein